MKDVLDDIWGLMKDLFVSVAKGLGRMILIILSATLAGAVIGAGAGLIYGDLVTYAVIGAVAGFILAIAILILHAYYGPY
ncbi:MAG: hypothetical protein AAGA63_12575 [Pseudomonadota bacterium]